MTSADTYPGCYGNYGEAYPPNNCKTCPAAIDCLRATIEAVNQ